MDLDKIHYNSNVFSSRLKYNIFMYVHVYILFFLLYMTRVSAWTVWYGKRSLAHVHLLHGVHVPNDTDVWHIKHAVFHFLFF